MRIESLFFINNNILFVIILFAIFVALLIKQINITMVELIKITERNGKSVVSAKELYDFLGYDKSQWSR